MDPSDEQDIRLAIEEARATDEPAGVSTGHLIAAMDEIAEIRDEQEDDRRAWGRVSAAWEIAVEDLKAEDARLREQLRIAEDALGRIASCGCTTCPPQPGSLTEAAGMAEHALICMSVVG